MINKTLLTLGLAAACISSCVSSPEALKIDPTKIVTEDYLGNGVQWSAYPHADTENAEWGLLMTDEKWERNFHRLSYMQPKLLRVVDQANWRYMVGFDKAGNPILDFNTDEVKAVERILKYAQSNDITVLFGEWGTPYKMHDTTFGHSDKFDGADDPKWISSIVEYLNYLIIEKGYTCIKHYNLINEPNGDWASTKGDFEEWKRGVIALNKALKEKGLDKYISVAGPDAVTRYDNPQSQYTGAEWVVQTVKQLDAEVGIYDTHDYTEYDLVRSGEFENVHRKIAEYVKPTGKQIIFGELGFSRNGEANQKRAAEDPYSCEDTQMDVYDYSYGIDMTDALIQSMNAGYSGSAAWALDDAMHTCGDLGNKNELKRWGMWNSLGTELCNNPLDENMRPWFYSWSLMCRYIPFGSTILEVPKTNKTGLRYAVSVYDGEYTFSIVNNSSQEQSMTFDLPNSKLSFDKYIYQENNRTTDADGFPTPVEESINISKKAITIPANSFVLLTSI